MKKLVALALVCLFTIMSSRASAQALAWPSWVDRWYFVGNTEELFRIRAAMAYVGGFESEAWTFPSSYTYEHTIIFPPLQLGPSDCMDAYYHPDEGPYDGAEDYLGMSVNVPGLGVVEIPELEDLMHSQGPVWMATACYGYQFNLICGGFWGQFNCPVAEP